MSEPYATGVVPQANNPLRVIDVKILQALTLLASTVGNYSGSAPTFTPIMAGVIATDTSNGQQWTFYNNIWNKT